MSYFTSLVTAGVLAVALAQAPAQAETPPNMLVVAQNIDDIVTIDPASAYEFSSGEYVANTYDTLVRYGAQDTTTLAPALATDWTMDAAAKTVNFTLRDGVTFHSGNPLRAEDVVGSWERVVALDKAPSFILTQLGWTKDNIRDMVKVDGNTVTVRYEGAFAPSFVLNVLAARPASVVDMQTVMANEVDGDMGHAWMNRNSAGTGPFILKTYRPAEILSLGANPEYYQGAPKMERVIIQHTPEGASQRLQLVAGDVDIAKNLDPNQISGLSGEGDIRVETYPQAAVHWVSFNQKVDALTDPAVWEAARYLVDYKGMTDTLLKGQMEIHQAFWPEGFPGALTDTPFSFDPEKAREILADAGVQTPINVTLDVISANPFVDMAQSLQSSFAQGGIDLEIVAGTGAQVITKYRARTHEAMLLYWGPDFMDPHSNAKAFAYNADNADDKYASTTTWRNAWMPPEDMNAMTRAALAEQDADKRLEMYMELQRATQAEAPFVIMFQAIKQVAMRDNVQGFVNGATSDYVFYRLVEKE
ncbi:ABC transporter substrate-binding protein [Sulfitobacter sp. S190]|uniref:ABC transporter substrate-binding protein n=1 Tax=Sulfitobacter sp. S190 TaxID=2867022 RepID=UPI0021A38C97|nr:ABC transporter substrate-binding protein [Sulfitobacter sp. S190]UWR21133.1 ABC transporter substrate-binding protein [Sulfitobacter sp. S190]